MVRVLDLLKAAIRREVQWEPTRTPDWELRDPPPIEDARGCGDSDGTLPGVDRE